MSVPADVPPGPHATGIPAGTNLRAALGSIVLMIVRLLIEAAIVAQIIHRLHW